MKQISRGVLVTDGTRILLGHATRSPRWDIPKGFLAISESFAQAAVRQLREETGLEVDPSTLEDLGIHRDLPRKDLVMFRWHREIMPDPATLHCSSRFAAGPAFLPEFDRFGIFDWAEALSRVGKSIARMPEFVRDRDSPAA